MSLAIPGAYTDRAPQLQKKKNQIKRPTEREAGRAPVIWTSAVFHDNCNVHPEKKISQAVALTTT